MQFPSVGRIRACDAYAIHILDRGEPPVARSATMARVFWQRRARMEPMQDVPVAPEPPDAVRVFFVTTDGLHRLFLHFRGRGDDIYWGQPGRRPVHSSVVKQRDTEIQITVGDQEVPAAAVKASYHQSGQVHLKIDDQITAGGPLRQTPPASLTGPIRAGWIISKPPLEYVAYEKRRPTTSAAFLHLDHDSEHRRLSCEVFFTPPGTHSFPALGSGRLHDRPPDFALTVTARLLVLGWIDALGEEFSTWHPDKSIVFVGKMFDDEAT